VTDIDDQMKIVFVIGAWVWPGTPGWPDLRLLPKQNQLIAGFVFVARGMAAGTEVHRLGA
jgi:hypothetical protein